MRLFSPAFSQPQSLAMEVPLLLCQLCLSLSTSIQEPPSATPCHTSLPVHRFPSITQCLSCPTFATHNSVLGDAQNCSRSIMMTDKQSSELTPVFSNITEPNFSPNCATGFLLFCFYYCVSRRRRRGSTLTRTHRWNVYDLKNPRKGMLNPFNITSLLTC